MGERRLVVHKPAELPLLMIGYHVPQTNNADFYALNILRTILFQGESSRMYQRLVDKDQIALDVSSHASRHLIPRWRYRGATEAGNRSARSARKAIYEELERAKTTPVTRQGTGKGEKYPLDGVLSPDADDQRARQHDRHLRSVRWRLPETF